MATKRPPFTWENGYQQPMTASTWPTDGANGDVSHTEGDRYVAPPSVDLVTSSTHNSLGVNVLNDWPTMYGGTDNPHGVPSWWKPEEKVDVLICGAGPSGLGLAACLLRQGVSCRVIDRAEGPLIAGRADSVQPRFMETIAMFGLATEISDEGPVVDRTSFYRDGELLHFGHSHQSDSRHRGNYIITQGQIERIYLRDLLRHKCLVERSTALVDFSSTANAEGNPDHPVRANVHNTKTGVNQVIQAKYLVGTDGAASSIRKTLKIPFDGMSTDIYWGIMDCKFESDYPHRWTFGIVMSSEHGACVVIPREDGYVRIYTQLDISKTGPISASRFAKDPTFAESGGNVSIHSITPDEVLTQTNKIFAPYTVKFASALSWFSIWKISERVARTYSSPDMRVHLAGDSAHVHSVLGAFGLNASILDITNLGWKLGLACKGRAKIENLLHTYSSERRKHAVRIIECSGEYLRFICDSKLAMVNLHDPEAMDKWNDENPDVTSAEKVKREVNSHSKEDRRAEDRKFLGAFFKKNGPFLLGVDCDYDTSAISLPTALVTESKEQVPIRVRNGVRAPNPRVCLSTNQAGYLYDKLAGPSRFHLIIFVSTLTSSEVLKRVGKFAESLKDPQGFYQRLGGASVFDIVVVAKALPFEFEALSGAQGQVFSALKETGAQVVFDDRAPDEDAHTTWGVNHNTGGVAVIRPDLWVGATFFPDETEKLGDYFDGFLQAV
ncbi:hypothetical protein S40288_01756 [Stachybotrys chartarum IBT 40288]|nr:hypothetical protein S40288_01756 [Stachybotrys chartarum IBT 40288]